MSNMDARIRELEASEREQNMAIALTRQALEHIVQQLEDKTRGNAALDERMREVEGGNRWNAGWIAGAFFVAVLLFKGLDYILPHPQPPFPIDQIVQALKAAK